MTVRDLQVVRVELGHPREVSWTVLDGHSGGVLEPAESFLAYLSMVGRSPNTVRAYAHDLCDLFEFLRLHDRCWERLTLEQLGEFVVWLQMPAAGRSGAVSVLPSVSAQVSATTVNRKLAAVSTFYDFHGRHGVQVHGMWQWRRGRRSGSWKPMLAHLGPRETRHRTVSLKTDRVEPHVLTEEQTEVIIDGCARLRDRFLFSLLRDTGVRIGEALGFRHEDVNARRCEVTVRARVNANGAQAKTLNRTIPVPAQLLVLYSDYLHEEYGALDSDYVFVNLWSGSVGAPLTYSTVHGLVQRLRTSTGVQFGPHSLRHTYATTLLRKGTRLEVVSKLLGHASVATTVDVYGHLTPDDTRRALVKAGVLPDLAHDQDPPSEPVS